MVTINVTERELELIYEAVTDLFYRQPLNSKEGELNSLKRKLAGNLAKIEEAVPA